MRATKVLKALHWRYGDRELTINNAKHNLSTLDAGKGEHHMKVENLLQGVNKALAVLRHVKAEDKFLNDMALMAQLVAKLPRSCQERWHLDRTDPRFKKDERGLRSKFIGWLERQGRAANSARFTQMSGQSRRGGGSSGPMLSVQQDRPPSRGLPKGRRRAQSVRKFLLRCRGVQGGDGKEAT